MSTSTRTPWSTADARPQRDAANANPFLAVAPQREPLGEPIAYRGYTIRQMRETVTHAPAQGSTAHPTVRTRFDVIEHVGQPPLENRRKTCVSLTTAQGWIDVYGNPTDTP